MWCRHLLPSSFDNCVSEAVNYKLIRYTLSLIMSHRIVGMLNSADYADYLPSSIRELYLCYLPVISYLPLGVCEHNTLILGSISTFCFWHFYAIHAYRLLPPIYCLQLLSACFNWAFMDCKRSLVNIHLTIKIIFRKIYAMFLIWLRLSMIDQSGNEFVACRSTHLYHWLFGNKGKMCGVCPGFHDLLSSTCCLIQNSCFCTSQNDLLVSPCLQLDWCGCIMTEPKRFIYLISSRTLN